MDQVLFSEPSNKMKQKMALMKELEEEKEKEAAMERKIRLAPPNKEVSEEKQAEIEKFMEERLLNNNSNKKKNEDN